VIAATGTTLTLGCNPSSASIEAALGSATATDACGTLTLTPVDGPVTGSCAKSQTRTWTATDACGNTSSASRTVTWSQDNAPPTITATGTTFTPGCNPSSSAIDAALGSATATDACGTVTITSVDGSVSGSCAKSQTRTWTATDGCGNTATASRTITWSATSITPVITATGTTLTLGCNPSSASI